MNETMEKSYKLSRIILTIIAFIINFNIIFNITFSTEGMNRIIISSVFSAITFGLSFPSTVISKKIIKIGNKLKNIFLKILFYLVVIPVSCFVFFYLTYVFIFTVSDNLLFFSLWMIILTICIILPYIQTIIVFILNFFMKTE